MYEYLKNYHFYNKITNDSLKLPFLCNNYDLDQNSGKIGRKYILLKNAARKCREKMSRKWGINKDLKMGGGINKGFWPKYIPLQLPLPPCIRPCQQPES